MPRPSRKAPAMPAGEVQRHLVRLGLTLQEAAVMLEISYEHMRAVADGRSRVREPLASYLRHTTLEEASALRLRLWQEAGFPRMRGRSHTQRLAGSSHDPE